MKHRRTRILWRRTPLAAAVAVALYPGTAVFSQALEEVVVTATRRELNVQDVAQSVSVFSTADIEKLALDDLEDVVGALPSLNLVNSMPGRNSIIMRGVSTGSAEYRTDSQVAVYLDDQPLTSISQQVDIRTIDIARIESLPGPQGTLFGSSSQTGTLRYITNKPNSDKFSAQVDIEGGTTKGGEPSYDFSGYVNIPVTDSIAIRAVGFIGKEGGYVDNVLGLTLLGDRDNADFVEEDFNDYKTSGGRVAARWQINPKWETTLSFIAQTSDADGSWDSDPALGDNKVTRFFDEYREDDWSQISMNVKGDLGFAELSVTGSYFDRDVNYEWDQMLYDQWRSVSAGFGADYAIYDTGLLTGTTFNWQKQNRYAYEVRLTSLGESRFKWMAGAFYEDVYDWWDNGALNDNLVNTPAWEAAQAYACAANYEGYDVPCPLPETNVYYTDIFDKTVRQKALFGEMTYSLNDRWSVTGGMRWFEYDRREYDIYHLPRGLPAFGANALGGRVDRAGKSDDIVYKFGTEFHFDEKRMVYALFSQGFRLGGNNSQRAAQTGRILAEYQPDTMNNYEVGLKSKWLNDRLLLNVSAFLMKWDDIQLNASLDPFWVRGTFNGGKAEQSGVEIAGSANITERFSLEGSIFLADPEFTAESVYPDPDDGVIPAGTEMPVSPKEKYWVAAQYTVPNFRATNGSVWARFSYSYQGKTWKDVDAAIEQVQELRIPSWTTSTLQFGYSHDSGWDAGLVVRNFFDDTSINWLSDDDYGSEFGDPRFIYVRTLQRPRSVSLTFTKKW